MTSPLRRTLACAMGLSALVAAPAAADNTKVSTIAGNGLSGPCNDAGLATASPFVDPGVVVATPDGGYLVADLTGQRLCRIAPDGTIRRAGGTGTAGYSGDGGAARSAALSRPAGLAFQPDGGYLVADAGNNRVRRVSSAGTISTVAGKGPASYNGDKRVATDAELNNPEDVLARPDGSYLIADKGNQRVRRVAPDGMITTVAGTGTAGASGDGGPATAALINQPQDLTPAADGGFLFADRGNNRVRWVSVTGVMQTVAGTGTAGFLGDGGPALGAQLNGPLGVLTAPDGSTLIADTSNNRIRRISPEGTISTLAGSATLNFGGDGNDLAAALINRPTDLALAPGARGFVFADSANRRIRLANVDLRAPEEGGDEVGDDSGVDQGGSTGPDGSATDGGSSQDQPKTLPSSASPVAGERLAARLARGRVTVKVPGSDEFVDLQAEASIPVGSTVDTTDGAVKLTSAGGTARAPQAAVFAGSLFTVRQGRGRRPMTELALQGGDFSSCPSAGRAGLLTHALAHAAGGGRRKLWGRGHGRFRTRGRNSAATVRGTIWMTEDRCDGTLTKVKRGLVSVRDFHRHRTVMVPRGHGYLARQPRS